VLFSEGRRRFTEASDRFRSIQIRFSGRNWLSFRVHISSILAVTPSFNRVRAETLASEEDGRIDRIAAVA
jgi:hypothetical protein